MRVRLDDRAKDRRLRVPKGAVPTCYPGSDPHPTNPMPITGLAFAASQVAERSARDSCGVARAPGERSAEGVLGVLQRRTAAEQDGLDVPGSDDGSAPPIRRVLATTTPGVGMNPAATTAWQHLTALQRAEVHRMEHDRYLQYVFPNTSAMIAHVVAEIGPASANLPGAVTALLGAPPAPVITQIASRRQDQGPGKSLPPGAPPMPPLVGNPGHDQIAGAYTRQGHAKYHPPTAAPRSNWSHFVDAQLAAAFAAVPGGLSPADQVALLPHVTVAYTSARELDAVHILAPGPALSPTLASQAIDLQSLGTLQALFTNLVANELAAAAPTTYIGAMGTPSVILEQALEGIWLVVLQAKQAALVAPLPRSDLPIPNLPRWGPVVSDGIGTWMHASFTTTGTWAAGSSSSLATTPMPWVNGKLRRRRKRSDRTTTLYVQGHLLNDHLGGPALAYNLVPLAADATSQTNNANMHHFYSIENRAKSAVMEMLAARSVSKRAFKNNAPPSPSPTEITNVWYSVVAQFAGHPYRAAAYGDVQQAFNNLQFMRVQMLAQGLATAGATTIDAFIAGLRANSWGLQYSFWTPIKDAVDAVVEPGIERTTVTIDQTLARLQDNDALWVYEDANVPSAIHVALRILRANGDVDSDDQVINNRLPSVAGHPFV